VLLVVLFGASNLDVEHLDKGAVVEHLRVEESGR
jgi:hypothetical protein